jgi:hypothetical protein
MIGDYGFPVIALSHDVSELVTAEFLTGCAMNTSKSSNTSFISGYVVF